MLCSPAGIHVKVEQAFLTDGCEGLADATRFNAFIPHVFFYPTEAQPVGDAASAHERMCEVVRCYKSP